LGRVPVGIISLKNRTLSPLAKEIIQASRTLAVDLNALSEIR
jgi:hypothetical protein